MIDAILVVCTGNICRSPMAEAMLRDRLSKARPGATVSSAGIAALVDHPADVTAVDLLAARGLDITSHRARQLTPELLAASDLVLVMDSGQQHLIERLSRSARGKIHRLGRFGAFDIPDPYRRGRPAFERALALIERGLDDFDRAFWATAA